MIIGANLERLRRRRKQTRYRLAALLGTSWRSVWAWETGRSLPSLHSALRLCAVLGCELEEILAGVVAAPEGWVAEPTTYPAA